MTLSIAQKNEFAELQKSQSLNTAFIRVFLTIFTMAFFGFAPIGLENNQVTLMIISAGFGFFGNVIAIALILNNRTTAGISTSILSFNIAFMGVGLAFKNLGSLTFLLILVPSTILIFSYIKDMTKYYILGITALLALLTVISDSIFQENARRIYLNADIIQLIFALYLILIVIMSAIYITNYLRIIKYFNLRERTESVISIALIIGVSVLLLFVFAFNVISTLNISQNQIDESMNAVQYTIQNFYENESLAITKASDSQVFKNYLEFEFSNDLSTEQQYLVETSLNMIKNKTGIEGNDFVAALLNADGELLAISDSEKLNFFRPEIFYSSNMRYAPTISNVLLSPNPDFQYIYFSHPVGGRFSDGILVFAYDLTILESLIMNEPHFKDSENYAILYDENLIQLVHGKNPEYQMTLALNLPAENISELIDDSKLPPSYNPESYPLNQNINTLLENAISLEVGADYDALFEGDDFENEFYAGAKKFETFDKTYIVSSFLPYTNLYSLISQNVMVFYIVSMILLAISVFLSFLYSTNLSKSMKLSVDSINKFIVTENFSKSNQQNFDEFELLGNQMVIIENMFKTNNNKHTEELYKTTSKLNSRVDLLKTAATISSEISPLENSLQMFNQSVNQIKDRFGMYFVGIYFLKEEYLSFALGTGKEGLLLDSADYRVHISAEIPICEAVRRSHSVAGSLSGHFMSHPLLQLSKDELALPIYSNHKVIGVLNLHSHQNNTFSTDDFFIFQSLANQIGAYYDKNNSLLKAREKFNDISQAYKQVIRENWDSFKFSGNMIKGYEYKLFDSSELDQDNEVCRLAWELKRPIFSNNYQALRFVHPNTVAFPIFAHGEVINVIGVSFESEESMNENIPILKSLVDQLGLIIDNLRMAEHSQKNSQIDILTKQITDEVFSSSNVNNVLQNLARALGVIFDISEVEVHLDTSLNDTQINGESYEN